MANVVEEFLTPAQEKEIVESIKIAEKNTSGEIRVHIEKSTDKNAYDRALEVFYKLHMDKTHLKNGVLFYVSVLDKKFAIIGDEGIDKVVPENFWESVKNKILSNFANSKYSKGLINGILEAGTKLKEYFPFQSDDTNELSDEISKG